MLTRLEIKIIIIVIIIIIIIAINRKQRLIKSTSWNTGKQAMASYNGLIIQGGVLFSFNVDAVIRLQKKSSNPRVQLMR